MGLLANTSKSNLLRKGPDVYLAFTHPAAKLHVTRRKKKCSASFLFKLASVSFCILWTKQRPHIGDKKKKRNQGGTRFTPVLHRNHTWTLRCCQHKKVESQSAESV